MSNISGNFDYVHRCILERTFQIRYKDSLATCFTTDFEGKRYLITARHVVDHIQDKSKVEIRHDGQWKPLEVDLVGHGEGNIDVSVLAPQELIGHHHPLTLGVNVFLAEAVYFLGFPYGLYTDVGDLNNNFPAPFVKKAIISSPPIDNLMYLDGHNNPGFSGGPVVRVKNSSDVVGIVTGLQNETQYVVDGAGKKGPYYYHQNTGMVRVFLAKTAEDLILKNPIGIDI